PVSLFVEFIGEADADASKCSPTPADVTAYETAKIQADENAATLSSVAAAHSQSNGTSGYHTAAGGPLIDSIHFGKWKIDTWYAAPYPEEYCQQSTLYLCEYCLKYMKSPFMMKRHKLKCPLKSPPGNEIYRDAAISIFEVDGRKNKIYCQNLCLLAKMFLDHKTLYYDVEPFLFYVMTERDNSYLLSKKEEKPGTPEKPLSDLGLLSYRSYWRFTVLQELRKIDKATVSLEELVAKTCMTYDDIVSTLSLLDMLVKDSRNEYVIRYNVELVDDYLAKLESKKYPAIRPNLLRWTRTLYDVTPLCSLLLAHLFFPSSQVLARSMATATHTKIPVTLHGIDGRYATALYSAASKKNALPTVEAELVKIGTFIDKDIRIQSFLETPIIDRATKKEGVAAILASGKYSELTNNLFQVLAENGRLDLSKKVISSFGTLMTAHRGEISVVVTSAKELDSRIQRQLGETLQKSNLIEKGQKLIISNKVDASIIGGLVIEIGDKTIDLSISSKVAKLDRLLQEA
ncbi:hypothetical protein HK100_008643, partial [Physocladia obscura]